MKRKRTGNYRRGRKPLDARHAQAIAMLRRMTHERIAKKLGVSRRTLYRWRLRPDFKKALAREVDRQCRTIYNALKAAKRRSIGRGDVREIERFLTVNRVM